MKTRIKGLLIGLSWALLTGVAQAQTHVVYSSERFTGTVNNRTFTIKLLTQGMMHGSNAVFGVPLTIQPTNGVAGFTLLPASYTLAVDQMDALFPFSVPDSTNTYSIWDLVQRGIYVLTSGSNAVSLVQGSNIVLQTIAPGVTRISAASSSNDLVTASNSLYAAIQQAAGAAGVVSFNSRTGMVNLTQADITSLGGASTGYVASAIAAIPTGGATNAIANMNGTGYGTTLVSPTVKDSLILSKIVDDATVQSELFLDGNGDLIVGVDQGMSVGPLGNKAIHGAPIGNGSGLTNLAITNLVGTMPDARLGTNVWGPANVRYWGATGNGTTNDTAAFVSANMASRVIYVPAGTYLIDPISLTNTTLYGDGQSTILQANTYPDSFLGLVNTHGPSTVRDLVLNGNAAVFYGGDYPIGPSDKHYLYGLVHDAVGNGLVQDVGIFNFYNGLMVTGIDDIFSMTNNSLYLGNTVSNCHWGIYLDGPNRSEYVRVIGNSMRYCYEGCINLSTANIIFEGNKIALCPGRGLHVVGNPSGSYPYRGHSLYSGNQINHTLGVWIEHVSLFNFINNLVHTGNGANLLLDRCTNGMIIGNVLDFPSAIVVSNSINVTFAGNHIISDTNLIQTGSSGLTLRDNWKDPDGLVWGSSGTYQENTYFGGNLRFSGQLTDGSSSNWYFALFPTTIMCSTPAGSYGTAIAINVSTNVLATGVGLMVWDDRRFNHRTSLEVEAPGGVDDIGMGFNGAGTQAIFQSILADQNFVIGPDYTNNSVLCLHSNGNATVRGSFISGTSTGISSTWTNLLPGLATNRIVTVGGIMVSNTPIAW